MNLYSPVVFGDIELANRLVMAPLTRLRASADGVPTDMMVEHYEQRASLGLIVTEGVYPSPESKAYAGQPGIHTKEQIAGWARVADAVHAAGGKIVMQVMHSGRVSHTSITGTSRIVAPSAIAIVGELHTPTGKEAYPVPHALLAEELPMVQGEIVAAAVNAMRAGLDGVQLHFANGYLLHEFLSPAANIRDDNYGGNPENRARFGIEVATAVVAALGSGVVGVRISPEHNIQDIAETDAADVAATYGALVDGLAPLNLAFLDVLHAEPAGSLVQDLRHRFAGPIVVNTGFASPTTRLEAEAVLEDGHADAVAVGRAAIANPDLVERWMGEHPENEPDHSTFYGPGAVGYTDYPRLVLA